MATYITLDQVIYVFEKACEVIEQRQQLRKCMKSVEFATALNAAGVSFGIAPSTLKACLIVQSPGVESIREVFQTVLGFELPTVDTFPSHMLSTVFEEVEQLSVTDHAAYKEAIRRVKHYNQTMERRKQHRAALESLDKVIHIAFSCRRHVFVSMDIEWWEKDSDFLLELGWSMWDTHTKELRSKHWIVDEHVDVRNGQFVPNKKWCFNFGTSTQGGLLDGLSALEHDLLHGGLEVTESDTADAVIVLVGHGVTGDLKLLREHGIKVVSDMNVVETQQLFWAMQSMDDNQQISLHNMLKALGIKFSNLHNAGNDARYTMEAFLAILEAYATTGRPSLG